MDESLFLPIADNIAGTGYSVVDDFFTADLLDRLQSEQLEYLAKGEFNKAEIGKGVMQQRVPEIRSDQILWFEPEALTPVQVEFWDITNTLREYLANYFRLSLRSIECHFAIYPPGSFYKRHLDQFQGMPNRLITFILYLNRSWQPDDGGCLNIYHEDGSQKLVEPIWGRLVCFRSDLIEHEVQVTSRSRCSITGWMRRDDRILG